VTEERHPTIDTSSRPLKRASVSAHPLDDDLVLYDQDTGQSFALNRVGWMVWERCDGEHSVATIVTEIAQAFQVSSDHVQGDVRGLLDQLTAAQLITIR
jgi:hypothetical protein